MVMIFLLMDKCAKQMIRNLFFKVCGKVNYFYGNQVNSPGSCPTTSGTKPDTE